MRILLATPLYPPEIAEPAPYAKELATRLSASHDVTVVTYANAVEPAKGVVCVMVGKQKRLPIRLACFVGALWKSATEKDVLIAESAVASSLPAFVVSALRKIPFVVHVREDEVFERAVHARIAASSRRALLRMHLPSRLQIIRSVQSFVFRRAHRIMVPSASFGSYLQAACRVSPSRIVVNEPPAERPEILPFAVDQKPNHILVVGDLSACPPVGPSIVLTSADDGASRAELWALRKESVALVVAQPDDETTDAIVRGIVADVPVIAVGRSDVDGALATNAAHLPDSIQRVLSDADLRSRLREEGARTVRERFSWDAHLQRLEAMLNVL